MASKKKQFKTLRRTARVVDKGAVLGDKTKDRLKKALDKISSNNYGTGDLTDDLLGQSSDFVTTLSDIFTGSGDDEVPTLHLVTSGAATGGIVSLVVEASGAQIEKGILFGPVTLTGGNNANTQVVTVNNMAANDYDILDADNATALTVEAVDSVFVQIVSVPPTVGVYRGVLTLQNAGVLAEVVIVRK